MTDTAKWCTGAFSGGAPVHQDYGNSLKALAANVLRDSSRAPALPGEGDVQAARTLLERALPVYRSTASPVELPAMESAETLSDKAHAVLAAVAAGELPPDLGASLVTAIGNVTRVVEVDELLRRIEALEKSHEEAR